MSTTPQNFTKTIDFNSKNKNQKQKPLMTINESNEERDIAHTAYRLFRTWRDSRNQVLSLFGDMNLMDYIDESAYRYVTSVFERDNIEEWQGTMHVPMTRNKINNISGRAIQAMPIGQIKGRGTGKHRRATILNNLYEHSEETNKYALTMADVITEAMVKGTVIVYEGHIKEVNLERKVTEGGKEIKKTVVKNKLHTQIVNLEDFYPSNIFVNTIDEMTGAAWREILPKDQFVSKYGTFEKANQIPEYNGADSDSFPAYRDDVNSRIDDGCVEVLHIYRKDTDEYIILANGFLLNPVKLGGETVTTSPLPFKHKMLPFFSMKFEHLSSNFFYGKSMPDKLREAQDQLDIMTNMVYDQSIMALFAPIITSSTDYIEDDFLRPGRRIAIDTGGNSLDQSIKQLDIKAPSGWYQFILGYTKNIVEEASVDALSSGSTAELADRTTAKAVEVAAAGIASTLSYFGLQIQEAIKQKVKLRIGNILDVYFNPENPVSHKIVGESIEYVNQAFNEFSIENAELSPDKDGKIRRGRKIIQVYKKESMPNADDLKAQKLVEKATSGQNVEIVAIPDTYIKEMFDFDVAVVADKRLEQTQATEQAVAMFKAQTYMQLFPDMINKEELAANLMQANGDDPSRFLLSLEEQKEQKQEMQIAEMGATPNTPGAPGGQANNFGNNMTQQVAGATQRVTQ